MAIHISPSLHAMSGENGRTVAVAVFAGTVAADGNASHTAPQIEAATTAIIGSAILFGMSIIAPVALSVAEQGGRCPPCRHASNRNRALALIIGRNK